MNHTRQNLEQTISLGVDAQVKATRKELEKLKLQLNQRTEELKFQTERANHLQSSITNNDKQVLELQQQLSELERGYNLQDAMRQIRSMKAMFTKQEKENLDLKTKLNDRERQLQKLASENGQVLPVGLVGYCTSVVQKEKKSDKNW